MEKPASVDHPIEEILKRRWSPRAFSDRIVERDKLQRMFEAARWAASSFNEQPWSFIVATKEKPDEYAALLSCLIEKNQQWARRAPVLMVSVVKLNFEKALRYACRRFIAFAMNSCTSSLKGFGMEAGQLSRSAYMRFRPF